MPAERLLSAQTSFVAGELSPLVAGRSGTDVYRNGAEALRNFRALSQGGVRTRPGMRHLRTLGAGPFRREAFVFSDGQRYELLFSGGKMEAFLPDGTPAGSVSGAPWTAAMLARMAVVIGSDAVLVFHQDIQPQRVMRTGPASWSRGAIPWDPAPFEKFAQPDVTLALSATTGSATLTTSAPYFEAGHVGVALRYRGERINITAVTDATTATGTIIGTAPDTAATVDWDERAWSDLRGYPATAAFADDRLIVAGIKSRPTALYCSQIGRWYDFTLGTDDDDAIWTALGGERVVQIRHVVAAEKTLLLTESGIFYIPTTEAKPLTPANIGFRRVSYEFGAAWIRPALFDGAVLFVDASGRTVREAVWNDTLQTFDVAPLTVAAEHLVAGAVALDTFAGAPGLAEPYAFVLREDGGVAVFHSVRAQKVASWMPWLSADPIRAIGGNGPDLMAVVERRTLNTWTLERLDPEAAPLDCAVSASAPLPTRTFPAAAPHLAGAECGVVSRGHFLGTVVVEPDGTVTVDALRPAVNAIEVGLGFVQRLRPMPFDADNNAGRGQRKRLVRALVQMDRAGIFRLAGRDIVLAFQGDDAASPAPVFTGTAEVLLRGISRDAQFDLLIEEPAAVTLLALIREVISDA